LQTHVLKEFVMRSTTLAALFALLAAGPALAGASSENQIDPKSLKGPDGKGAYSSDPGNATEGTPGPTGPAAAQQKDLNKGENAGGASTGAGSGTSGSDAVTHDGKTKSQQQPAQ
jgi:hypothetical protein